MPWNRSKQRSKAISRWQFLIISLKTRRIDSSMILSNARVEKLISYFMLFLQRKGFGWAILCGSSSLLGNSSQTRGYYHEPWFVDALQEVPYPRLEGEPDPKILYFPTKRVLEHSKKESGEAILLWNGYAHYYFRIEAHDSQLYIDHWKIPLELNKEFIEDSRDLITKEDVCERLLGKRVRCNSAWEYD